MRGPRPAFKMILAASLSAGMLLAGTSAGLTVAATGSHPGCSAAAAAMDLLERRHLSAQLLAEMQIAGVTQAQIDDALLTDYCQEAVPMSAPAAVMVEPLTSASSDVTFYAPQWHLDSVTHYYNVVTTYHWNNSNFSGDVGCYLGLGCDIGGPDGMAISFNTSMVMAPSVYPYWYFYSNTGKAFSAVSDRTPDSQGDYGAGFKDQDREAFVSPGAWDLNMYNGFVEISVVRPTSGCANVQAIAAYSHTWNSTSVTGISIGRLSVGFSWNTTSNKWDRTSPPSSYYYLCA